MPYNLLILPLLGGYILINRFNGTRFIAERSDGNRFIFQTAIAGVFLLFTSTLLVNLLAQPSSIIDRYWHTVIPYQASGVTALAFLLAFILPVLGNRIWKLDAQVEKAIILNGEAYDLIFSQAMRLAKPVLIMMKSGKAYVGRRHFKEINRRNLWYESFWALLPDFLLGR